MDGRRVLGASGERIAEEHLLRRGLRVVARNARTRWGEIDLVCRDAHGYVFVEVKTRDARSFVSATESVTRAKVARLSRLAWAWLAHAGVRDAEWRLLVVAVTRQSDGDAVELIPVDRF
ncbi:MAG TPA: YraN family protein [Candidatus Limnocylindria bacterium]|nr:YraN family protein [Candidatus Limnocylindria bacterium]